MPAVESGEGTGTTQPEVPKKRGGKPFVKGDPRIAPIKRRLDAEAAKNAPPPPPPPPLVIVEGEGLLRAIRHVLANPPDYDVTEELRQARGWLADNRDGFFRERSKLEAAEMVAQGKAKAAEEERAVEDVGATAALGLLDELLGKYGEKHS